jgi:hypothetical protein
MNTTGEAGNQPREHTEMPAEGGQPQQQPEGKGAHPQAPAEGADPDLGQTRDASNEEGAAGNAAGGDPD